MSAGKRYKFNGSQLQVSTGAGAAKIITGITADDPALVTAVAHGFTLGTVVKVEDVVGMSDVNDRLFVVDNPETDDFELAGVDASGYAAYVSGGTAVPLAYTDFCELTGANQQDGATDDIEATTICSTAKEFESGLGDSGTLTLDYNFAPNALVQARMREAKSTGERVAVRVTLPGKGGSIVMLGSVQQTSFSGSNGALWTGSATLRLTGEIFVMEAV